MPSIEEEIKAIGQQKWPTEDIYVGVDTIGPTTHGHADNHRTGYEFQVNNDGNPIQRLTADTMENLKAMVTENVRLELLTEQIKALFGDLQPSAMDVQVLTPLGLGLTTGTSNAHRCVVRGYVGGHAVVSEAKTLDELMAQLKAQAPEDDDDE